MSQSPRQGWRRATSASDGEGKRDNEGEGDVAGEMGDADGVRGRRSMIGMWRKEGQKVVTASSIIPSLSYFPTLCIILSGLISLVGVLETEQSHSQ